MSGINLHNIVRSSISAINGDEAVTLYQSNGSTNVRGTMKNTYNELSITAQFQPLDADRLIHAEAVGIVIPACQAFLYSDATMPVAGIVRSLARTGDFVLRNGLYYLVTAVLEDWSNVGWCNVELTEQTAPPDLGG